MAVSVDDLECEILRASALRAVGEWIVVVGSENETSLNVTALGMSGASIREGDESRLSSIDRTACSNSFQLLPRSRPREGCFCSASPSPSEFSDESGGDKIAPVGINRLFSGGGDW